MPSQRQEVEERMEERVGREDPESESVYDLQDHGKFRSCQLFR